MGALRLKISPALLAEIERAKQMDHGSFGQADWDGNVSDVVTPDTPKQAIRAHANANYGDDYPTAIVRLYLKLWEAHPPKVLAKRQYKTAPGERLDKETGINISLDEPTHERLRQLARTLGFATPKRHNVETLIRAMLLDAHPLPPGAPPKRRKPLKTAKKTPKKRSR